ncbi:hypothetical protein HYS50_03160 [Candidatus Woesearchaeota archaeon]|nr:hypothetical protein [Candidatus Woesearchaeota archaeon]
MAQQLVTQLLETDLISLKFLLKRRLTNVHDLNKKEQQILNTISNALQSVRNIEQFLITDTDKNNGAFYLKRRQLIIRIMRSIVHHFCEQIRKGEDIAHESIFLREELDNLYQLCKRKIMTQHQQEQLLKTLTDYSRIMI